MNVVLAGGGTAGHVEPALALAEELADREPAAAISFLGTTEGVESRLVPARGYPLDIVPRAPLPRRPSADLFRLPGRLGAGYRSARRALAARDADVVVGFGGYVCVPAYVAAHRAGVPIVVHEANTRPGLANRIGARVADAVATSYPNTQLREAVLTGVPLRRAVARLDRSAVRARARAEFGLDPVQPVLLVFGGSQGARRINAAILGVARDLVDGGIQVLHATGPRGENDVRAELAGTGLDGDRAPYVVRGYVDAMELAYAAGDLALCRGGAMTCAELAAVGLPAVFVPLPHGNGEQRRNAEPMVEAGGGLLVDDAALDPAWIRAHLVPLLTDPVALESMSAAALTVGRPDAAARLADLVATVVRR